jgi:hypothetical protein
LGIRFARERRGQRRRGDIGEIAEAVAEVVEISDAAEGFGQLQERRVAVEDGGFDAAGRRKQLPHQFRGESRGRRQVPRQDLVDAERPVLRPLGDDRDAVDDGIRCAGAAEQSGFAGEEIPAGRARQQVRHPFPRTLARPGERG